MESQNQTIVAHLEEEINLLLAKTDLHDTSVDSMQSLEDTRSAYSKDSDEKKGSLPTFTNEVVVIRPELFYENEDC